MKGLYPLALMTVLLLLAGACPAMAEGNEIGMDERQGLEQSGFSVDLPPSWTVDFSGNFSSGSLRANDSSLSYAMVWMRDPGSDPDELLDLAKRSYQGTDLAVTSANFEEILAGVGKGNLLQMQYTFKGHPAQKLFASWRSEHSDRLFAASCYSLKGGDLSGMAEDFKSIIGSFSDREVVQFLTSRATTDDAWAIVLQDMLSSRSFALPISLIGGSVGIEVSFRGGMEDGVYRVVSEDVFTASIPEEVYVRPAAVQEFLQDQGYQARLVQNRGRVYVAVIDPQGLAQAVSASPVQPLEMVGVVLNEDGSDSLQGTVYRDLEELAAANSLSLSVPPGYLEERCQPSRYVELQAANESDQEWQEGLEEVLQGHSYTDYYLENTFDCSNTSQICWAVLQQSGYDSRLLVGYQGHPLDDHMWVVVRQPGPEDRYLAVEATNIRGQEIIGLGKIEMKDQYYSGVMYNSSLQYSMLHPEEGMWLVPDEEN